MPLTENLGQFIREAREKKGISRVKLAEFTGISPNSLVKYEKAGKKDGKYPAMSKMVKIAEILEIDPRWIFQLMVRNGDVKLTRDFDFYFFFKEQIDGYNDEHMIGQLYGIDHVIGEFSDALKELKNEIAELKATTIRNGPDQKDPSRSEITTTETEAVEAASTRKPGGN